ncbi:diaminopimelate epimerase [Olivibacter ginsenosidimutans]|uniref:Diaminopimelate epimerase n=1 Tax=Olivibacter ginsenosidimutans TaxID=1176537 RepID=A0ABP9C2D9_9SPHI
MHFFKYQGAGNDFILIDNRTHFFDSQNTALVAELCDRRFGIGADGLMLLQTHADYDFEMVYYNADGRIGSMCGNGGRCIVAFAKHLGLVEQKTNFLAVDGVHEATLNAQGDWVSLKMIDVNSISRDGDAFVLNTGSPHYVKVAHDLDQLEVYQEGKSIRYAPAYAQEGINVNFVEPLAEGYAVRTYERGVEDETLACGTGVTAVALAMAFDKKMMGDIMTPIKAKGGDLTIRFSQSSAGVFNDIYLEGPANLVFEGTINRN